MYRQSGRGRRAITEPQVGRENRGKLEICDERDVENGTEHPRTSRLQVLSSNLGMASNHFKYHDKPH